MNQPESIPPPDPVEDPLWDELWKLFSRYGEMDHYEFNKAAWQLCCRIQHARGRELFGQLLRDQPLPPGYEKEEEKEP